MEAKLRSPRAEGSYSASNRGKTWDREEAAGGGEDKLGAGGWRTTETRNRVLPTTHYISVGFSKSHKTLEGAGLLMEMGKDTSPVPGLRAQLPSERGTGWRGRLGSALAMTFPVGQSADLTERSWALRPWGDLTPTTGH